IRAPPKRPAAARQTGRILLSRMALDEAGRRKSKRLKGTNPPKLTKHPRWAGRLSPPDSTGSRNYRRCRGGKFVICQSSSLDPAGHGGAGRRLQAAEKAAPGGKSRPERPIDGPATGFGGAVSACPAAPAGRLRRRGAECCARLRNGATTLPNLVDNSVLIPIW